MNLSNLQGDSTIALAIKFKSQAVCAFQFMSYVYYQGVKQQKWPSTSPKAIGNRSIREAIHDFLLVFHRNLHHVRDIIDYFP